jgi:hypothetical protein
MTTLREFDEDDQVIYKDNEDIPSVGVVLRNTDTQFGNFVTVQNVVTKKVSVIQDPKKIVKIASSGVTNNTSDL